MSLEKFACSYELSGHTVVITGGAGILGGAIAVAVAACQANAIILDRDVSRIEALRAQAGPARERLHAIATDVLDTAALERARAQIVNDFGTVHALVNAAGGNAPQATTSPSQSFFSIPADAASGVLALNLLGTVFPCQVFGQVMAERSGGAIVNISSMSATRPMTRVPLYAAAKAAVDNFTRWLAVHMAQEYSAAIRVNALAPGFFLTQQNRYLLTDRATGELTERGQAILAHTPMARFGVPEDLIDPALWLLSPAAAFVTGIVLPVDGGFSAYSGV